MSDLPTDTVPQQTAIGWFFNQPYLLLTLTPLFWAGNFVMGRGVAGHVPPYALANLRWIIAASLLLPFAWPHLKRDWPVVRQNWAILLFLGAAGPTIFNTITYVGLNHTTALNGLILQSMGPVLIVFFAFVCFGDRLTWHQALGIAVSLSGVAIVISKGDLTALLATAPNIGDVLILVGFMSWAIYTVFLRRRPDIHWLTFAVVIAGVACVANLPLWIAEHLGGATLKATWLTLGAVLYAAIFPSIVSYNFYNRGVQLIGSSRAGVFLHLVPLFGSGLAIALLGEQLARYHLVGFVFIIAGVTLAARKGRTAEP